MDGMSKATAWREGWLAGNRWAFDEKDEDSIDANPYGDEAPEIGTVRMGGKA